MQAGIEEKRYEASSGQMVSPWYSRKAMINIIPPELLDSTN